MCALRPSEDSDSVHRLRRGGSWLTGGAILSSTARAAAAADVPAGATTSTSVSFGAVALLVMALAALIGTAVLWRRQRRQTHEAAGGRSRAWAEGELRRVVDTTPLPAALLNRTGEIAHVNQSFVATFGYRREQLPDLAAWWAKAYPEDSYRQKVIAEWCGQLQSDAGPEILPPYETRVTCADGAVRLVEWRATRLGPHSLVVGTDLTERQRSSDALQASEKRYRLLLEHSPEAIVVLDAESGRFLDCNSSAEALFKCPRSELLELGPLEVSPPMQPGNRPSAALATEYIAAARAGRTPIFEWVHRDRTGRTFACEVRLLQLPDLDGREVVRGSIVDISARKHSEEILRENEERFRLLIENSTELVAQVDREGRLVYVSPNHLAITGYTAEEMIGRGVFEFIHPDDATQVLQAFQSARSDQSPRVVRYRFKDGSWHWLESAGRRFVTSGGVEMAAVISRDITERMEAEETRKRLEAQLRQAQKMEAIGTLAGGIAHDFNNILTGLFGSLQLARDQLAPDHPAQEMLAAGYKACERARDLVAKILTFSRAHDQRKELHPLGPIVREAAGLLRASLPATIEILVQETKQDLTVLCDAGQIHQVVMNLGANAAHAMREHGGQLTFELDAMPPDRGVLAAHPQLARGRVARLTVRDTGCGMAPETRERIFEPFFTTKPVGEGTGLGLAVVHGIVEEHAGAIAVESSPNVGTTVRIWLPAAKRAGEVETTAPQQTVRGRGERVLFVDDEPVVADLGSRMMRGLGYDVTAFTRPSEALSEFKRTPGNFALLVTDLTMPGLTGPELTEEVHRIRPQLPVLVMTGYLRPADVERARSANVRHFLEKPFTLESLAAALRQALDETPPDGAATGR